MLVEQGINAGLSVGGGEACELLHASRACLGERDALIDAVGVPREPDAAFVCEGFAGKLNENLFPNGGTAADVVEELKRGAIRGGGSKFRRVRDEDIFPIRDAVGSAVTFREHADRVALERLIKYPDVTGAVHLQTKRQQVARLEVGFLAELLSRDGAGCGADDARVRFGLMIELPHGSHVLGSEFLKGGRLKVEQFSQPEFIGDVAEI